MPDNLTKIGMKGLVNGPKNLAMRKFQMLKPKFLWFEITELCNSRCTMCNIWKNRKTHEPMGPEEIKKVLSDPLFKDVIYINNSGGEATVRPDLQEMVMAEHEALPNAAICISTNGLMPERAYNITKYAIEHGVTMQVGMSLDGIGEKHDEIRGVKADPARGIKGNFERVDWLIRKLVDLRNQYPGKLWIAIGSVLTDSSIENVEEVKKYTRELGVHHEVQWFNNSPYYNNTGDVKETQTEKLIQAVRSLPPNLLNDKWEGWLKGKPIKFTCFAMHTFCVLKSNGDISVCLTHWNQTAGNVRINTPTEVWKSAEAKESRKVVANCSGCLNSWGTNWSWSASFFPYLKYYAKNPGSLKAIKNIDRSNTPSL